MRTLSSTLLTAQQGKRYKPLCKVVLSRTGETTRGYNFSRILSISHSEEPSSYKADITLHNSDNALTSIDFKSYQAVISEGMATGIARTAWAANTAYALDDIILPATANGSQYRCAIAGTSHATTEPTWPTDLGVRVTDGTVTWEMDGNSGDEYSRSAPLKVRVQELHSGRGILRCILRCIGIPDQLKEDTAIAEYTQTDTDTNTVKALIDLIAAAGTGLSSAYNGYSAITVVYDTGYDDSIINTFCPAEYFSIRLNENRWDKIQELLDYTRCKARIGNDGKLHILIPKPNTTGTTLDIGSAATNRADALPATLTCLDLNNPANANGVITSVEVWAATNLTGLRVGTFYLVSGTTYKCRDSAIIGSVISGSKQTITTDSAGNPLAIAVVAGDVIGCYYDTGSLKDDSSAPPYTLLRWFAGERIDPGDQETYHSNLGSALSLYGIGVTYDYEYEFNVSGQHTFFDKAVRLRFIDPNKEIVRTPPASTGYTGTQYTGNDTSEPSYTLDPKVHTTYRRLTSDAQAALIAAAIIERYELDAEKGFATVPMNVGQELWDYVKVTDSRQGDTRIGNIQYLSRSIKLPAGNEGITFNTALSFGKTSLLSIMSNLSLSETSAQLSNEQIFAMYDSIIDYLQANQVMTEWLAESKPDNLDDIADGFAYKRLLSTQVSAGKIYLSDQSTYLAGYDPSGKRRTFTAEPTTPYDLGDLWADETYVKRCTTARATGAYQAGDWTQLTIDEMADGATYKKVLATDISAGHILLSSVEQSSTYRTTSDAEKSTWNGKPDDMDEIADGTTSKKVLATDISAGHINLYSGTVKSAEWYNESGVVIDATIGITLTGELDLIFTAGASTNYIYNAAATGNLTIYAAEAGKNVELASNGGTIRVHDKIANLGVAYLIDIGDATNYFDDVYADDFVNCCTFFSFDSFDDLELIKAIKSKTNEKGQIVIDATSLPAQVKKSKAIYLAKKRQGADLRVQYQRGELQRMLAEADRPEKQARIKTHLDNLEQAKEDKLKLLDEKIEADSEGYMKAVSMAGTISLLLGAMKQLLIRVETLEAKL